MENPAKPLAISVGDYRYELIRNGNGTFRCKRELIDKSQQGDELSDWSQLPEQVRTFFSQTAHG